MEDRCEARRVALLQRDRAGERVDFEAGAVARVDEDRPAAVELVDAADFDHVRAHVGADLRACAVSINQLETSLRALEMGRDQSMRVTGAMPITFV